jgi:predicted NAD/FAD-binding protein
MRLLAGLPASVQHILLRSDGALMNIAIIGSGIAGLTCAWRLAGHHQVTLFEAGATAGGHTATVDVATPDGTYAIDTGFIVYNDRTYPRFMGLLSELGISGQKTQMSFSVHNPQSGLEYNGHTLGSLFAQRRNLVNPKFWCLLKEIVRFNRVAKRALRGDIDPSATLQSFLEQHRFGPFFARHYILPMGRLSGHRRYGRCAVFHCRFFYAFLSIMVCWMLPIARSGTSCRAARGSISAPYWPSLAIV